MDILQSVKMAWRSIKGKKGRSVLTVLSIFIGIAAVMTIVSVMEGMKEYTRQQYAAMGSNKISVNIYNWSWDPEGYSTSKDYFPELYDYCNSISEYVSGITPNGYANATAVYGTKSSANMQYEYDEQWNLISAPPDMRYGSDQYAACNSLTLAKGRDLTHLDCENYNQVVVLGSMAAKSFFDNADPVGKVMQLNGNNFTVVGVYASRASGSSNMSYLDNFILIPYTARRILGGEVITSFDVKARSSETLSKAITLIGGYVSGLVGGNNYGGYDVYSESTWQESETQYLNTISLVLGGIAAISLLVGGIGIMNIMLVTVTERTREIGIRRAIGAQRSSIVLQFLIEAGMLCGMGGIVGIIFGTIGSYVLGKIMYQMVIYPQLWVTLGALGLSVFLGLLFGGYPAVKASRLQPVDALKAE